MKNVNEFKAAMALKGYNITTLAKDMTMSAATLSRKVNGESEFKASEMKACERLLGIRREFFFDE